MFSKESTESAEPENEANAKSAAIAETAAGDSVNESATSDGKGTGGRQGLAIAVVLLLACGGLVGYGMLNTDEQEPKPRAVPTVEVTYEVTGEGTVEISYLARSEAGAATVEKGVTLPWKKTVDVPVGKSPTVAIVLDGKGGQAACTLAIRDKHVQRATATGEYGRATCTGELPAADH
ncbi:hypothetical protein ACWD01_36740 [Streptomyces sp. NPDC002835]|jgi:hypothetical protein